MQGMVARWTAIVAALALAGCADAVTRGADRIPDGPESFRTGYAQGCQSGYSDANRPRFETQYRQDKAAYANDAQYREGWQRGYVACHEEETRFPHFDSGNRMN